MGRLMDLPKVGPGFKLGLMLGLGLGLGFVYL
jgi:hypothetical protein